MVSIYQGGGKRRTGGKRKGPAQVSSATVTLEKWDPRGRGVCRTHQPVLFVDGALPGGVTRGLVEIACQPVALRAGMLWRYGLRQ